MAQLFVLALVLAGVCYGDASRIVGGSPTTIEQYPYIVQVDRRATWGNTWSQSCGANILNELYVLSAAHCFEGINYHPSQRRIRAGTTNRNSGGTIVYIAQEYNHPSYRVASRFDGDISVIRLSNYLGFTDVIKPVSIVGPNANIPDNTPVIHAGWGTTAQGGSPSPILLDTVIYTINRQLCRERYQTLSNPQVISENMICAGLLDVGGRDACQGDSGGPLYYSYSNILVGVVSWGQGCAHPFFPGVSAAVSPYVDWIRQITSNN